MVPAFTLWLPVRIAQKKRVASFSAYATLETSRGTCGRRAPEACSRRRRTYGRAPPNPARRRSAHNCSGPVEAEGAMDGNRAVHRRHCSARLRSRFARGRWIDATRGELSPDGRPRLRDAELTVAEAIDMRHGVIPPQGLVRQSKLAGFSPRSALRRGRPGSTWSAPRGPRRCLDWRARSCRP